MSARDPQPGEKYQVRRSTRMDWKYVEVLSQEHDPVFFDAPVVTFRVAIHHPDIGISKRWSLRKEQLQLKAWRRAVTQGNVRSLPEHWGPDMLPDEPVPLAVRVRQWCDKQPPSEALDELKSILGEAR